MILRNTGFVKHEKTINRIVAAGAAIFPVNGKVPGTKWGPLKDKETPGIYGYHNRSLSSISRMNSYGFGIGPIKNSTLFVIDLDDPSKRYNLERLFSILRNTLSEERNGKVHYYIRIPREDHEAIAHLNTIACADGFGEIVSLRGNGKYVVGAGSAHDSGVSYSYVNPDAPIKTLSARTMIRIWAHLTPKRVAAPVEESPVVIPKQIIEEIKKIAEKELRQKEVLGIDGKRKETTLDTFPHPNGAEYSHQQPNKIKTANKQGMRACHCLFHNDRNPSAAMNHDGAMICHSATCVENDAPGSALVNNGSARIYFTSTVAKVLNVKFASNSKCFERDNTKLYTMDLPYINEFLKNCDKGQWNADDFTEVDAAILSAIVKMYGSSGRLLQMHSLFTLLKDISKENEGKHTFQTKYIVALCKQELCWSRKTTNKVLKVALEYDWIKKTKRGSYILRSWNRIKQMIGAEKSGARLLVPTRYLSKASKIRQFVMINHMIVHSDENGVNYDSYASLGYSSPLPVSKGTARNYAIKSNVASVQRTIALHNPYGTSKRGQFSKGDVFKVIRLTSAKIVNGVTGNKISLFDVSDSIRSKTLEELSSLLFNFIYSVYGGGVSEGVIKHYFVDCIKKGTNDFDSRIKEVTK